MERNFCLVKGFKIITKPMERNFLFRLHTFTKLDGHVNPVAYDVLHVPLTISYKEHTFSMT